MTWIKRLTILCFCAMLLVPLLTFNFQPDVVSQIDNRKLAESPFSGQGSLSASFENYVNDRIGLRDEMILAYTVLNDRLFGKMVHPNYSYGEDGYIFGAGLNSPAYGEFHEAFADMAKKLQDYCNARDIPFLLMFDPSKAAVQTEHLPDGLYYDRSWVDQFLQALDDRGVRYLDTTPILREKQDAGEMVFNQKYDANHWNAMGAFYAHNEVARVMQQDFPAIHITELAELDMEEKLETSLRVSKFPIEEYVPFVPDICTSTNTERITATYFDELRRDRNHRGFDHFVNEEHLKAGAPRALVFQGSYLNSYPFFMNAFGEYIMVHSYQNILNFDYYFSIFQPECVVFEVAEFTMTNNYFDLEGMKAMHLNPPLSQVREQVEKVQELPLDENCLSVSQGKALTTITWQTQEHYQAAWLTGEEEYDFASCEEGYQVTMMTDTYLKIRDCMEISALSADGGTLYRLTLS